MAMAKKVSILNVPFDHRTEQDTICLLMHNIHHNKKTFVVTANPEIVMYAQKHPDYLATIQLADCIVPDGTGIILGAKLLKNPLPERIAGFDLMKQLLTLANEQGLHVFFLGSKEEVLKKAIENVQNDYPNVQIAGSHHGYFDEHDQQIVLKVKQAKADLIFVALGYPKQERWIKNHLHRFEKGIFMGVGGSFDVLAGVVKRAPLLWRKFHLEWLYRLIKQPSRLKRMVFLPLFVWKVMQLKIKKGRAYSGVNKK